MDILLQSDGQLYPPRHAERKKEPPKRKPAPPPPKPPEPEPPPSVPCPPPEPSAPCAPSKPDFSFEELLLIGVAFIVFRSSEKPDIPLLLALAYILFDNHFSISNFLP